MYLNNNDSFERMHEKVTNSFERPNRLLNIKINTNQKTKDYMKDKITDKLNLNNNDENLNPINLVEGKLNNIDNSNSKFKKS